MQNSNAQLTSFHLLVVDVSGGSHEIRETPMINNQILAFPILHCTAQILKYKEIYKALFDVRIIHPDQPYNTPTVDLPGAAPGISTLFAISNWLEVNRGA